LLEILKEGIEISVLLTSGDDSEPMSGRGNGDALMVLPPMTNSPDLKDEEEGQSLCPHNWIYLSDRYRNQM
jgi:hypothetical protein